MNIGDSGYKYNNVLNSQNGNNITNNSVAGNILSGNTVSGNAQILQVYEGQLFHGQILNVTNAGEVSIQLDNNSILMAKMSDALNLNIGDSLNFMVKEKDGSNIVIKPFGNQESSMKDNTIFKALELNNFTPTEKNYLIAEKLMNNNMPVDRAGMQRIMQQAYKYPDASIDTLISLTKSGLPVNDNTISQYEAYMNNTHQLSQDISTMAGKISNFTSDVLMNMFNDANVDVGDVLLFQGKMLDIFSDDGDAVGINNNIVFDMEGNVINETVQDSSLASDEGTIVNKEADSINQQSLNISEAEMAEQKLSALFDDKDALDGMLKTMKNLGLSDENIQILADKSKTPMQFFNNLNAMMSDNVMSTATDKDDIKSLLLSDNFKKLFADTVKKKFSLDGNNMDSPKEVDDLYKNIYEKTSKLLNSFSNESSMTGQDMKQAAKGMQERLDFIRNLNEMFTYAQIPVNFSGNDMNSELFVYMNKKNLSNRKDDISAMLHLDMEHLGATDVHVSLHGSTVNTKFYVDDETSARIIDEHMNILEKAINDSGFSLINEVITREISLDSSPKNMVVEEMLGKDLEKSVKRYSFDVRT